MSGNKAKNQLKNDSKGKQPRQSPVRDDSDCEVLLESEADYVLNDTERSCTDKELLEEILDIMREDQEQDKDNPRQYYQGTDWAKLSKRLERAMQLAKRKMKDNEDLEDQKAQQETQILKLQESNNNLKIEVSELYGRAKAQAGKITEHATSQNQILMQFVKEFTRSFGEEMDRLSAMAKKGVPPCHVKDNQGQSTPCKSARLFLNVMKLEKNRRISNDNIWVKKERGYKLQINELESRIRILRQHLKDNETGDIDFLNDKLNDEVAIAVDKERRRVDDDMRKRERDPPSPIPRREARTPPVVDISDAETNEAEADDTEAESNTGKQEHLSRSWMAYPNVVPTKLKFDTEVKNRTVAYHDAMHRTMIKEEKDSDDDSETEPPNHDISIDGISALDNSVMTRHGNIGGPTNGEGRQVETPRRGMGTSGDYISTSRSPTDRNQGSSSQDGKAVRPKRKRSGSADRTPKSKK